MHRPTQRRAIAAFGLMALISGCTSSNDQILQQSLARQSEQNAQLARHTQQIAEASRQLIESDAHARHELIEMQAHLQDGLQTERQSLDRQRDLLETERRAIAQQRLRDPLIAAAIINTGILLAGITPLLLAYWVLRNSWAQASCGMDELLIQDLVSETSIFLPKPRSMLPAAAASPITKETS